MYKEQKSFKSDVATLFLVATPIGNLQEMTPRAIDILNNVDIIACEDTRTSSKLLNHFGIKKTLISHHKYNEFNSTKGIIDMLSDGKNIALISDAGYPLYSDPGSFLVKEVIEKGFNVVPVSGANASINALVASGLKTHPYTFFGFLDANTNQRQKQLTELKNHPYTIVFYEAPHRILKTLKDLLDIFGNRKIVIAKEISKQYETFIRCDLIEAINHVDNIKGEIVLLVEGYTKVDTAIDETIILDYIHQLKDCGYTNKDAIKEVCAKYGVKKNDIYDLVHKKE